MNRLFIPDKRLFRKEGAEWKREDVWHERKCGDLHIACTIRTTDANNNSNIPPEERTRGSIKVSFPPLPEGQISEEQRQSAYQFIKTLHPYMSPLAAIAADRPKWNLSIINNNKAVTSVPVSNQNAPPAEWEAGGQKVADSPLHMLTLAINFRCGDGAMLQEKMLPVLRMIDDAIEKSARIHPPHQHPPAPHWQKRLTERSGDNTFPPEFSLN